MKTNVNIIGAGLAGCEAAYYLAQKGLNVNLFEQKPLKKSPAHHIDGFAELVCSNSLKSNDVYGNACGLLKEEMRILGSMVIDVADGCSVPAGAALAVDRDKFAQNITDRLRSMANIEFIAENVQEVDLNDNVIIATGPLTTPELCTFISNITNGWNSMG